MKAVASALGVSRSNVAARLKGDRPKRGPQSREGDAELVAEIRRFVDLDCTIAVERTLLELEFERCRAMVPPGMLGVWVPNTPAELNFWLRQPIDQMTSDRPDIAIALRDAIAGKSPQSGW